MIVVTPASVLCFRLFSSFLLPESAAPPSSDGAAMVCRKLFGIQGQESTAAALSLWNRLGGPFSLKESTPKAPPLATLVKWFSSEASTRGMVRCHGQRGTLHVYETSTWPVVCGAIEERLLGKRRKSAGKDALESAHKKLQMSLESGSEVCAKDLSGLDFSVRYSAFMSVTLAGLGTRTNISGRTVIAPRSTVAPSMSKWEPPSEHEALVRAARCYFERFGPATEPDFRYYLGIVAAKSKAAVQELKESGYLIKVQIITEKSPNDLSRKAKNNGSEDWLLAANARKRLNDINKKAVGLTSLPVLLLGKFDVLLLGHADKSWLIDSARKKLVWSSNADVRAVVLIQGRIKGTWQHKWADPSKKTKLVFTVEIFPGVKLSGSEKKQLHERMQALSGGFFMAKSWECTFA